MIYVTLRFDDGTITQYTEAFKYMKKFNLPGTVYIIGKNVDSPNTVSVEQKSHYISIPRLKELADSGWEIGYHSYSHDSTWIKNPDIYERECDAKILRDNGFDVTTFALPYSVYNHEAIKYLKTQYDGIVGIPSSVGNSMEYCPLNKLFRCFTVTRDKTLSDIVTQLQRAISQNEYLILLFHRIEKGPINKWSFPLNRFRKLIKILDNYQRADLIEVLTVQDAIERIS